MVERFADKQIEVLEQICKDNFKANSVSDYGIEISEKGFIQMIEQFQMFGWLKISHTMPLDLSGEEPGCDGKTLIYYEIINKEGLSNLFLKLKNDYPKWPEPLIQEKTLELISRDIGEFDTGIELVRFLQKCGVEKELIVYPNTKWRMINDILVYLSTSAKNGDRRTLFSVIEGSIHPLMHNGDMTVAQGICDKFNQYLFYDGYEISYSQNKRKFGISYNPTEEEESEFYEQMHNEWQAQLEENLKFLQKPENKERIAIVRKAYQIFINIVEAFCLNPSRPTAELNDAYIKVKNLVTKNASELKLFGKVESPEYYLHNLNFPFSNLFGAEAESKNRGSGKINWDEIRPALNRAYGEINTIFREVNGSDILSEPDIQKTLNDVSLLVSETKKKNESLKIKPQGQSVIKQNNILKVKIAEMPELKIKGLENLTNKKGEKKYKFPYKLPAGTGWKNIIFQFEDDENIYIQAKRHKHYANYKNMGFLGKGKNPKPSEAWNFLNVLSKQNGEISIKDTKAKDTYKHHKQKLADMLKSYFSIDSDPFYPYEESKSYRIKMTLLPPQTNSLNKPEPKRKKEDALGLDEFYKEQAREV